MRAATGHPLNAACWGADNADGTRRYAPGTEDAGLGVFTSAALPWREPGWPVRPPRVGLSNGILRAVDVTGPSLFNDATAAAYGTLIDPGGWQIVLWQEDLISRGGQAALPTAGTAYDFDYGLGRLALVQFLKREMYTNLLQTTGEASLLGGAAGDPAPPGYEAWYDIPGVGALFYNSAAMAAARAAWVTAAADYERIDGLSIDWRVPTDPAYPTLQEWTEFVMGPAAADVTFEVVTAATAQDAYEQAAAIFAAWLPTALA